MSGKMRVSDCKTCPYYQHNRGTPDFCQNAECYIRDIRFCAWNEWARIKREEESNAGDT